MSRIYSRFILVVALLCTGVQAQALDKEVQIDILTNKIATLVNAGKNAEALPYFEELEGMQAALPESFNVMYIDVLDKAGKAEKALARSDAYLKKYGKKGKYYGQVIEVLSRRAMEVEKAAKSKAEIKSLVGVFVTVPAGCFRMGDVLGDGISDEKPVHEVCVSAFHIGKFEVTHGLYEGVMGSNPSVYNKCGPDCPVEYVSWDDAQAFITRLNWLTGQRYRLPTEAEWEYAARSGGKEEKYSGGSGIDAVAWYKDNSGGKTHPVGQKQANGLGLYDMSGNVWEWVQDWYGDYDSGRQRDPQGASSGSDRVFRGGGYHNEAKRARVAGRANWSPDLRRTNLGFRLAAPVQ